MGFVQSAANSSALGTLTVTLGTATTAGNCLFVLVATSGTTTNPSAVSAMTLGGAAGNFVQVLTYGSSVDAAIGATWTDLNCAGGQTAVAITCTGGSGTLATMATVYEWAGVVPTTPLDKSATAVNAGALTWSSTASAATTQADEVQIGAIFTTASTAGTITGPVAPWTNISQVSQAQGSFNDRWMTGYKVVNATGTATYAGSVTPSSAYIAQVCSFKLLASKPVQVSQAINRASRW